MAEVYVENHTTSVLCLLHSIASSNYSAHCVWFSVITYKHCLKMILKRYEYIHIFSTHMCTLFKSHGYNILLFGV